MKKLLLMIVASLMLVACGVDEEFSKDRQIEKQEKEIDKLERNIRGLDNEIEDLMNTDEDEPEEEEEEIEEVDTEEEEKVDESENNISDIEWDVDGVADADLDDTSITDIRINEDASADEERYIVLVDLEWDVQNKPKTTKEMLDMYSDHLAANLSDNELIHELVLFWTVPYHNEEDSILKRTYENKDDGMFMEDEVKDINVFD